MFTCSWQLHLRINAIKPLRCARTGSHTILRLKFYFALSTKFRMTVVRIQFTPQRCNGKFSSAKVDVVPKVGAALKIKSRGNIKSQCYGVKSRGDAKSYYCSGKK